VKEKEKNAQRHNDEQVDNDGDSAGDDEAQQTHLTIIIVRIDVDRSS
jgi:hypothetical protein